MQRDLKYKLFIELPRYALFGFLGALLNFGLYFLFVWRGVHYLLASLFALFLTAIFSFFTNRFFVFKRPKPPSAAQHTDFEQRNSLLGQGLAKKLSIRVQLAKLQDTVWVFIRFLQARMITGVLEIILLYCAVGILSYGPLRSKIVIMLVLMVANYIVTNMLFKKMPQKTKNSENAGA